MADQAHDWTDEQIERLQRKFRREYNAAAREMRVKLDDWMKDYDKARDEWQSKVRSGEAKQGDFDDWLSNMAQDHDFIAGMAEALARDAVRADKLAMDYVNDAIPEVYAENANFAAWSVERQLGYDTHAFDLYDQSTVRHMIAEGDIAEGLVLPKPKVDARKDKPWNQRKFTSALTQSILQGESIPNTAKRLQMVLGMDERAAVSAARTAMTGAENAGRVDSYKRAQRIGIELEQEWLATHDERTRITHRLLDGEHVPVGERFVPEGYGDKYSIGFPGDPTALGEMVYNCRCTLVAWLPSIAEEDNRSWAKLPDGMTYDEWKHGKKEEIASAEEIFKKLPDEFKSDETLHMLEKLTQQEGIKSNYRKVVTTLDDSVRKLKEKGFGVEVHYVDFEENETWEGIGVGIQPPSTEGGKVLCILPDITKAKVEFAPRASSAFAHELAHFRDLAVSEHQIMGSHYLSETLLADASKRIEMTRLPQAMLDEFDDAMKKRDELESSGNYKPWDIPPVLMGRMNGGDQIFDIYDALTRGQVAEYTNRQSWGALTLGHGQFYYSVQGYAERENWANWVSLNIYRPDLVKLLEADKPELVAALKEMEKKVGW